MTITITGTNDQPTVDASAASGFTEALDASAQDLSQAGTVSFDDVDTNDVIDISAALTTPVSWSGGTIDATLAATLAAGFSASATDEAAPGNVPWTYNVSDVDLDFLAAGETITFAYTVTATDNHGATATDTVSFTITGTNDAPVLDADATPVLNSVAEDAGAPVGAIGTLVSALVDLDPPSGGLDNVTDADSGAVTGIALVDTNSLDGDAGNSTNNGASWTSVGSVSPTGLCCWRPTPVHGSTSDPIRTSTVTLITRSHSKHGTEPVVARARSSTPRSTADQPRSRLRRTPQVRQSTP